MVHQCLTCVCSIASARVRTHRRNSRKATTVVSKVRGGCLPNGLHSQQAAFSQQCKQQLRKGMHADLLTQIFTNIVELHAQIWPTCASGPAGRRLRVARDGQRESTEKLATASDVESTFCPFVGTFGPCYNVYRNKYFQRSVSLAHTGPHTIALNTKSTQTSHLNE